MTSLALESLPPTLQSVRTRPLFVARLAVRGYVVIGPTPNGFRRVGIVTGGTFEGERLSGEVIDGGSDWQELRKDNATTLDVRIMLKTSDGAFIGMSYQGLRHGSPEDVAKLERGEVVDPERVYFRTNPIFETSAPRYDWINRILAIGIGHRLSDGPVYSVFEVL
ncbi:MAG: DUF3237 domain-containing protein [Burkholderiaceae bacterium]|jgi:hypothetical protein